MALNWEVVVTEVGGTRTDVIPCKNKREALKVCKEQEKNPKYEAVYVQANNGTEIVDFWGGAMTFKEIREASGMARKAFGEYFGIPYRTVQNWELGERDCPEYLLDLMVYKLKNEGFIK